MRWQDVADAAPELASLGREAFDEQHMCILGTIRADGWPRLSPCEVYLVGGEMMLGMMPNSRKALDMRRDPRITVMTTQSDRIPKRGDFKIYGQATEIFDKSRRDALADTQEAAIDWRPTDPFHVFSVDVLSATYISFGVDQRVLRWTPEGGLERLRHPDD